LFFFVCQTVFPKVRNVNSDAVRGLHLTSNTEGKAEAGSYYRQLTPLEKWSFPVWEQLHLPAYAQNLMAKPFFRGSNGKLLRGPSG
jgi:hypothetical protein